MSLVHSSRNMVRPRRSLLDPVLVPLFLLLGLLASSETAKAQSDGIWEIYLYANEVRDIAAVGEEIYAATSGGVVRWSDAGFEQWNRAPLGLLSDSLRTVGSDAAGNLWFGTERAGVSIFSPEDEEFEPYTSLLEPIPGDRIRRVRIQTDSEGREVLLVAAEQGYSWFVDGDLRFPCQEGVDICEIPSFDILDILLVGEELWIATSGGTVVQTADGTWEPRDTPGPVDLLAPDGGTVLAASGSSVLRWVGTEWVEVGVGLPTNIDVTDILTNDAEEVWVAAQGSGGGVFRLVPGSGWSRLGDDVFPATSIAVTESGRLFAGASDVGERLDGIWEWRDGDWVQRKIPGPALRAFYRSMRFSDDGSLWFSTAERSRSPLVGSYDGETWVLRNGGENGALNAWTWNTLEVAGQVFLAHCCCRADETNCRLESLDSEGNFEAFDGIREIWALDVDDDGFLWGSTNHGTESLAKGVYRIDPVTREFDLFDRSNVGFPSNQIASLRVANRVAWIGTFANGLVRWDFGNDGIPQGDPRLTESDDEVVVFDASSGNLGEQIIGNSIRQIEVGTDGRIWVGTTSGLSIYENGVFTNIEPSFDRFPNAEVTALALTEDGGAWIGTRDTGVTQMEPDPSGGFSYANYQAPLLPNPNVEALALSPNGKTIWCGTSRGLAAFTPFEGQGQTGTEGVVAAYPNPFVIGCRDGLRLQGGGGLLSGVVIDQGGRILSRFERVSSEDVIWDVTDEGEPVAPGLYIVRVQGPRAIESVGVAVIDGECRR